ncbi:kinase-like domain-containing protein [Parachaetomium inaequale]|uniref:Kinase-like domain-containing protein n=1 Tax=Parachaetomium inaequale TaxID=2588326 RepID=A0AAN6PCP8_9PEZI|nr:kinase-like domain-containing protein [Parachaetomium inaequale]
MTSRPTLPYFAPADQLPAPLPSVAEILASTTVLSGRGGNLVVRVREHYAVKYGRHIHLQEGENMLFVRQLTNVPLPTVYALFHDEKTGCNFIVQEYIPGRKLDRVWASLSPEDKRAVVSQLRRAMDELRSIPSPGYYGGIWRQPIQDWSFVDPELQTCPHRDTAISGPHESEEDWAEAMWRCLDVNVKSDERRRLPLKRRHYKAMFQGHKPVFTHADLSPGNIRIREDNSVVIIDWQRSGWYPSFWEYCSTMLLYDYEDDWGEWASCILDEYVPEFGWMQLHREWIMFC